MKRRRTERANNFYKVVGIPGISDSAIQKVLDRLQSHTVDPDKGTYTVVHIQDVFLHCWDVLRKPKNMDSAQLTYKSTYLVWLKDGLNF